MLFARANTPVLCFEWILPRADSESCAGKVLHCPASARRGHHIYSCLCRYGDSRYFSNPKGATAALKAYLEGFFKGYGRPVWLTEWALADFGGASNNWAWTFPTYAQQVGDLLMLNGHC